MPQLSSLVNWRSKMAVLIWLANRAGLLHGFRWILFAHQTTQRSHFDEQDSYWRNWTVRWLRSRWSTSADRSPSREWCPTPSPARSTGNRPLSVVTSVSTSSKRPASRNSSARTWNQASVATLDSACLVKLFKIQRHLRTLRLLSHRPSVRPPTTAAPSAPVRPVSVRCQSTNSNWSIPFTNAWQITSSCHTETTAHPESLDISSFMNKLAFFPIKNGPVPSVSAGPFSILSSCLSFPRLWSDCLSFLCNFVSFFWGNGETRSAGDTRIVEQFGPRFIHTAKGAK